MSMVKIKPLDLYCGLMEEIKLRFHWTEIALLGGFPPMPGAFVKEFCRLQLRMVCELLAIGCVVFTTCAVAAGVHLLLGWPWAVGFVLGALWKS